MAAKKMIMAAVSLRRLSDVSLLIADSSFSTRFCEEARKLPMAMESLCLLLDGFMRML